MSDQDPSSAGAPLGDPPDQEGAPPTRLGRYTVLEEYARGGMAQVFLAQRDAEPDIRILKRLLVEWEPHEVATMRFHREAQLASLLDHENIAQVTDTGFEGNSFCIAMEFIAGKDVESMMHRLLAEERMLPPEISIGIILRVLDGLAYAHDARDPEGQPLELVHRDLSPRNVLVSWKGEVKIIDFGLAYGRLDDFKTAPGMILGTLRYASPEQARTQPLDRRSDLYTIGVVLYEMLSGRPWMPFGKPVEVLQAVTRTVPEPLSTLNPNLPKALDAVLKRALEKEPADRFPNAQEFREALAAAAGSLAHATAAMLGDIPRRLFPDEERRSAELVAWGKRRFEEQEARWAAEAASRPPPVEAEEPTQDGPAMIPTAIVRKKSGGLPSGFSGMLGVVTQPEEQIFTQVVRQRRNSSLSKQRLPGVVTMTISEASYAETRTAPMPDRSSAYTEVGPAKPVRSVRSMPAIPVGAIGAIGGTSAVRGRPKVGLIAAASAAVAVVVLVMVTLAANRRDNVAEVSVPAPVSVTAGVSASGAAHATAAPSSAEPPSDPDPEPSLVAVPPEQHHETGRARGGGTAPAGTPARRTHNEEPHRVEEPKPAPPPPEPKRADPYAALYQLLERAKKNPSDNGRLIDQLGEGIIKAAEGLSDEGPRKRILRIANSSMPTHDLDGLETCLQKLSAARARSSE